MSIWDRTSYLTCQFLMTASSHQGATHHSLLQSWQERTYFKPYTWQKKRNHQSYKLEAGLSGYQVLTSLMSHKRLIMIMPENTLRSIFKCPVTNHQVIFLYLPTPLKDQDYTFPRKEPKRQFQSAGLATWKTSTVFWWPPTKCTAQISSLCFSTHIPSFYSLSQDNHYLLLSSIWSQDMIWMTHQVPKDDHTSPRRQAKYHSVWWFLAKPFPTRMKPRRVLASIFICNT